MEENFPTLPEDLYGIPNLRGDADVQGPCILPETQ